MCVWFIQPTHSKVQIIASFLHVVILLLFELDLNAVIMGLISSLKFYWKLFLLTTIKGNVKHF